MAGTVIRDGNATDPPGGISLSIDGDTVTMKETDHASITATLVLDATQPPAGFSLKTSD